MTSGNGVEAAKAARQALIQGYDPLDAAIAGVNVNELDPNDMSVGYGGIPNEEGVVQLDAAVMDGRTLRAGAVGALEGCKTPSKVAKLVMERTDRVFLVGAGAAKVRERARLPARGPAHVEDAEDLAVLERAPVGPGRLDRGRQGSRGPRHQGVHQEVRQRHFRPQGTIHMSVRSAKGDLVGVTTTSGLFFKIPGRLGDSPVIGAGIYSENGVGSCGSTGRGEANLLTCGSHTVVEFMRQGKSPEEACLLALKRIDEKTHRVPRHRDDKGRPKFNVNFYAVDAKGKNRRRRHLERQQVRRRRQRRREDAGVGVPVQEGQLN